MSFGKIIEINNKLRNMPIRLSNIADRIFQGLITGADTVFILKKRGENLYFSEETNQEHFLENELLHPLCKGSLNIRRYNFTELDRYLLFPYKMGDQKTELLSTKELSKKYPQAWEYLKNNRSKLESREHGKWKNDHWYAFGRTQNLGEMEQKKILTPSIANHASFMLDIDDFVYFIGSGGGGGGGYGITIRPDQPFSYQYLLGLLNSKLIDNYLKSISSPFSGGYYAYNRQYIEQLPIRDIDFNDPADVKRHERMVALVENMLALHKRLAAAGSPQEKELLQRQIGFTDREIDALVYELYGLTEEEIKIVEGA